MYLFENISFINEGEQAEEYFKRKQEKLNADKAKDDKYSVKRASSDRLEAGSRTAILNPDSTYQNPKYDDFRKAKKTHDKYKKEFPDAVPKFYHKDEKDYTHDKEKDANARRYADRLLDNDKNHEFINRYSAEYNKAHDAARRHYRRTHRHESGIFESVSFINE